MTSRLQDDAQALNIAGRNLDLIQQFRRWERLRFEWSCRHCDDVTLRQSEREHDEWRGALRPSMDEDVSQLEPPEGTWGLQSSPCRFAGIFGTELPPNFPPKIAWDTEPLLAPPSPEQQAFSHALLHGDTFGPPVPCRIMPSNSSPGARLNTPHLHALSAELNDLQAERSFAFVFGLRHHSSKKHLDAQNQFQPRDDCPTYSPFAGARTFLLDIDNPAVARQNFLQDTKDAEMAMGVASSIEKKQGS